jgi:hypothetical protein
MTEIAGKQKLPRNLVVYSATLAALAFALPIIYRFLHRDGPGFEWAAIGSLAASALWIVPLAYGFKRHGRAAVWLLLETPLALWWPLALLMIELSCRYGDDCL